MTRAGLPPGLEDRCFHWSLAHPLARQIPPCCVIRHTPRHRMQVATSLRRRISPALRFQRFPPPPFFPGRGETRSLAVGGQAIFELYDAFSEVVEGLSWLLTQPQGGNRVFSKCRNRKASFQRCPCFQRSRPVIPYHAYSPKDGEPGQEPSSSRISTLGPPLGNSRTPPPPSLFFLWSTSDVDAAEMPGHRTMSCHAPPRRDVIGCWPSLLR